MNPERVEEPRFLTDVILELGFTTEEKIRQAVESGRLTNKTAEQILVENGDLTDDQLGHAVAERYGTEYIDLDSYEVDMDAARMVTRSFARRCHAVPIAFSGDDGLVVAIADTAGAAAAGDIARLARMKAKPVVTSREAIAALIDRLPELELMRPGRERRADMMQPNRENGDVKTGSSSVDEAAHELVDRLLRLADPEEEVDLSPDLKVVSDGAEAEELEAQKRQRELHAGLDRLLVIEEELRAALHDVSEKLRGVGILPADTERYGELESRLEQAEAGRDQAERERDELRRRLTAIRDTLGRQGPV